ncbi:MAG: gliding motility-associated C-terminal domain-containing protein [Marinifilaceae bacterium]
MKRFQTSLKIFYVFLFLFSSIFILSSFIDPPISTVSPLTYKDIDIELVNKSIVCVDEGVRIHFGKDNKGKYEWVSESGRVIKKGGFLEDIPLKTTTYKLRKYTMTKNLVVNGDFESGNKDFISEYDLAQAGTCYWVRPSKKYKHSLIPESTYFVGEDASAHHPNFRSTAPHNGKNQMIVNGSSTGHDIVWQQKINVIKDKDYIFNAYGTSVHPESPARFNFSLRPRGGRSVILGKETTLSGDRSWENFYEVWHATKSGIVTISLVNINTVLSGNDFSVDDISFEQIKIEEYFVTVHVKPRLKDKKIKEDVSVCKGAHTLTFDGYGSVDHYEWSLNGKKLKEDGISYDVNLTKAGDAYKCKAYGIGSCGGGVAKTFVLDIKSDVDASISANKTLLTIGEILSLEAHPIAGEDFSYEWTKDGDYLGSNAKLDLKMISLGNEGTYKCLIKGKCGEILLSIDIEIYKPDIDKKDLLIEEALVACPNANKELVFDVSGIPEKVLTYRWWRDGRMCVGPLKRAKSTNKIMAYNLEDNTEFICIAYFRSGIKKSKFFHVKVYDSERVKMDIVDTVGFCVDELELKGSTPIGGVYTLNEKPITKLILKDKRAKYKVVYKYTDTHKCVITDTSVVNIAEAPYINLVDEVKIGSCNTYQIEPISNAELFKWKSTSSLSKLDIINPVFKSKIRETCFLTVTDKFLCTAKDTIKINVAIEPELESIKDTTIGICNEIKLRCKHKSDGGNFVWSINGEFISGVDTYVQKEGSLGINNYSIILKDRFSCPVGIKFKVTVVDRPMIMESDPLCFGDTLKVKVKDYAEVNWSDSYKGKSRMITKPGEYNLFISDKYGCTNERDFKMIALPKITLRDTMFFRGEELVLEPTIEADGSYYIDWGDGINTDTYTITKDGDYTLTVSDMYGCVTKDTVSVDYRSTKIIAPNAFTPGVPGANGLFYLKDKNISGKYLLIIYNREGCEVYRTDKCGVEGGWDGTYKGNECQSGAFVWIAYNDDEVCAKGYVMLIK